MVDFKGLIDAVGTLETGINTLTKELETVKKELERVKTEYHSEANSNTDIRKFILEKTEKWKEKDGWENRKLEYQKKWRGSIFEWKSAEESMEEISKMSDVTKRRVDKKSVILVCKLDDGMQEIFFCDDKIVMIYAGSEAAVIYYKEITDIDKSDDGNLNDCTYIIQIHTQDENECESISVNSGSYHGSSVDLTASEIIDVLYTFLWDIYEFING